MLSRFIIASKEQVSFNFMATVTMCSDFGAPKNKVLYCFHCFPVCHEVMGLDAMILAFWMLRFKPTFSLSSSTFVKKLFSSSLLSATRVASSAYLRLLVFLPGILIPACASSSLAFRMMYSAYKLNRQGDNIQPWYTPFTIWNQCVVPCPVLTIASWPAYRFLRGRSSGLVFPALSNFPEFIVAHTVKGIFSGTLLLFQWSSGCWQFNLWFLCLFWNQVEHLEVHSSHTV